MVIIRNKLATKYSRAFIRLNKHVLTHETFERMAALENFLSSHKKVIAFLSIPSVPLKTKQSIIETIVDYFKLPGEYKTLISALLIKNRISYLLNVLRNIALISAKLTKKEAFVVKSSHELSSAEKQHVIAFIQKQFSPNITASFQVDTTLISGIRIQSIYHYWERSIAKQLKTISQTLHLQGAL